MNDKQQINISIVTMFFDIGRGNWLSNNGEFQRSNDKYFGYFSHLAKLENDITVFTTDEFSEHILTLRQGKPTNIVTINLDDFQSWTDKIAKIQQNPNFLANIPLHIQQNPEYASPLYTLITNLKTHFVSQAIQKNLVQHEQVAWVDFGYCRDETTLQGIQHWQYNFDPNYVHLFTIRPHKLLGIFPHPRFARSMKKVKYAMFNNKVYIIAGITVATQQKWGEFLQKLTEIHLQLLNENIIDDEQGVYLMCNALYPCSGQV